MDDHEQKEPKNWQLLHDDLKDGLQHEIRLTRELLSNLHQEEVSLMLHDTGSLNQILEQRSQMLERLSALRLRRLQTTERMEKLAIIDHKQPSLEHILPPDQETSAEILSLSDQLMALTERMSRQQTQNQHLSRYGDHYPQLQRVPEARAKRKASVATYHLKK